MSFDSDTIAAPATPPGRGGVGVIRVSGSLVPFIAKAILRKDPTVRCAVLSAFFTADKKIIDQGIALYFRAPHSFTGEEVLELHGHGGPIVMDLLLQRVLGLGARIAKPGEFMERAFLNHKIDLLQAEAVADLINATSAQAAQNAVRSLQGEFSKQINLLLSRLIELRTHLEATIDFPEDVDAESIVVEQLSNGINSLLLQTKQLQRTAQQGMVMQNGITVIIVGKPNAGKSSLFNCLVGQEAAIVTAIPGTTRDILRAQIHIDGLPINLLDTAGIHNQPDVIESEGIRRALAEIKKANHVLLIVDAVADATSDLDKLRAEFFSELSNQVHFTVVYNKIDLLGKEARSTKQQHKDCIYLSAKTQEGLDLLKQHLKDIAGFAPVADGFSARRRHLDALAKAEKYLYGAKQVLTTGVLELVAEDLAQAQRILGEITGEFTPDDLLDKIFSEFCLGK
jgi:tRNA modification GTPase